METARTKIAVIGAGGFVGNLLVNELSQNKNNHILAISLNIDHIKCSSPNVIKQQCDIFDTDRLESLLSSYEVAYYLLHMMAASRKNFPTLEKEAVNSFCKAAKGARVKRIIYLGGLGKDDKNLSRHLASRHETGEIIRNNFRNVTEFRASIVIGEGSAAVETIKQSVTKLNFLILPSWANTLTQPICAEDIIEYLLEASDKKYKGHKIYEIGGKEVLTYKDLINLYAESVNKNIYIFVTSLIPRSFTNLFLGFLIDKKIRNTVLSMAESLECEMIATDKEAQKDFPNILPKSVKIFFR